MAPALKRKGSKKALAPTTKHAHSPVSASTKHKHHGPSPNIDISLEREGLKIHVNVSPAKAKHPDTLEQLSDEGDSDTEGAVGLSFAQLQAKLEDLDLETASRTRALEGIQSQQRATVARHWQTRAENLDARIQGMSFHTFYTEYGMDADAALRGTAMVALQPTLLPTVEQSARKRKAPWSPQMARHQGGREHGEDDSEDVFGTSKKARAAAPSSKARKGRTVSASARKPRPHADVSTDPTSAARDSNLNFVYRAANPALPPTPSIGAGGTTRRPRRGESIYSIQGSPLGECVADDGELDADDDDDEDDSEGWNMMERHEASRVEEQGQKKGKGGKLTQAKGKGKAKAVAATITSEPATRRRTRSSSISAPPASTFPHTSANFDYNPPAGAPDYADLEEEMKAQWRKTLDSRQMSPATKASLKAKYGL